MMADDEKSRRDPERILARIRRDEALERRGRLKVYLGMAAGVGKTYSMLQEANRLRDSGLDVVVGYVETHDRADTEAMVASLPVLDRRIVPYREIQLEEMDLDRILELRPEIVLVDELAHTNAPGSRHKKRYQDVREILDHGIHVHTTLNIQHLESLADLVEQYTGARMHERVPDLFLETADEVELVDLTPAQLQERIREGKVYIQETMERALSGFFRRENLTALREMALNFTARLVDRQLLDYKDSFSDSDAEKAGGEKILVAVGASPYSAHLIRTVRRTAFKSNARWFALYVESAAGTTEEEKRILNQNLSLVSELGGELVTAVEEDPVKAMLRVARERGVTQIVVGKPLRKSFMDLLRRGTIVDRLIRESQNIAIHVVPSRSLRNGNIFREFSLRFLSPAYQYGGILGLTGLVTLSGMLLGDAMDYHSMALIYLSMIVLSAPFFGPGPMFFGANLSAFAWDYLFIPPHYTIFIKDLQDWLMFGMYFLVALIAGRFTSRLKSREKALVSGEERLRKLFDLSRDLGRARGQNAIVRCLLDHIHHIFHCDGAILLPGEETLDTHSFSYFVPDPKEESVALWCYRNRKPAGAFTETLPSAKASYLPLSIQEGILGVLALDLREPLNLEDSHLLNTVTHLAGLTLEREIQVVRTKSYEIAKESEKLYQILINSISHELKTPLTIIKAAAGLLAPSDETTGRTAKLADEILEATDRMDRLVGNLLDMNRLESGFMKPGRESCSIREILASVMEDLGRELRGRIVEMQIPRDLPFVSGDFTLLSHALFNIIHNYTMYTPPGSYLWLRAREEGDSILVDIVDNGPGLPDQEKIFDKFYRGNGNHPGGSGLGLTIAKGIIEAHGGTLRARNRTDGGAQFTVEFPRIKEEADHGAHPGH